MRLPRSSCMRLAGALVFLLCACDTDGSHAQAPVLSRAALDAVSGVSAEVSLEPATYVLTSGNEWLYDLEYDGQDWVALRDGDPARLSRINREGKVLDPL